MKKTLTLNKSSNRKPDPQPSNTGQKKHPGPYDAMFDRRVEVYLADQTVLTGTLVHVHRYELAIEEDNRTDTTIVHKGSIQFTRLADIPGGAA
mgnify:CR=1 FL=1|jgi:hypothetical protein